MSKHIEEGNESEATKIEQKAALEEDDEIFDRDAEKEDGSEEETKHIVEKKDKISHRAIASKKEVELTLDDL